MRDKLTGLGQTQAGVSMLETMLVFPILLIIGFGIVHASLVYQAQANLEYAALMAARVGASTSMDVAAMVNEVAYRMQATSSLKVDDAAEMLEEKQRIAIEILNPTLSMFYACGRQPSRNTADCLNLASCEIPYFGQQFFSRTDSANDCNGVSVQDANILRIRVSYKYDSKIPFLNRIRLVGESRATNLSDEGSEGLIVSAIATVRMQSPARLTFANADAIYSDLN